MVARPATDGVMRSQWLPWRYSPTLVTGFLESEHKGVLELLHDVFQDGVSHVADEQVAVRVGLEGLRHRRGFRNRGACLGDPKCRDFRNRIGGFRASGRGIRNHFGLLQAV